MRFFTSGEAAKLIGVSDGYLRQLAPSGEGPCLQTDARGRRLYLVTRYEPQDGPQTQIVSFLRAQFGDRVLTAPMVKSTAISDAGLTKQTLYEVGRENFTRATYDRAMEALTAVNLDIEALILEAWGHEGKRAEMGCFFRYPHSDQLILRLLIGKNQQSCPGRLSDDKASG